jgi:ATP-dependent DNA helicase PIF1
MSNIIFTEEQANALHHMRCGRSVFITGQAGTGKSAILTQFLESLDEYSRKKVAVTSTTGISAIAINGRTIHSWAGIGLGDKDAYHLYKKINGNKDARERWRSTEVLVIDEVSMLSADLFEKLEYVGRLIRRDVKPFGGLQLILTGDFCQLPVINATKYCFESEIWDKCVKNTVYLQEIKRQSDPIFCEMLKELRLGCCSDKTTKVLLSRILPDTEGSSGGIEPTRLFSKNKAVDAVNRGRMQELVENGAEIVEYKTYLDLKKKGKYTEEQLNHVGRFLVDSYPDVKLCIGAQVMLTWNLNTEIGLANGSRGVIKGFSSATGHVPSGTATGHVPSGTATGHMASGTATGHVPSGYPIVQFKNGLEVSIGPVRNKYESDNVQIMVEFMPLCLGWALSIHKSQGATLDYVITNLGEKEIWEYGQAYVALSRVRTLEGLILEDFDKDIFYCNPRVYNFYKQLEESDP